jgi:hypothetical protein
MKAKIILGITFLLISSCDRSGFYSKEKIDTIAKNISHYKTMYVYFPVDNKQIGCTPLYKLNFLYDELYCKSYKNLSLFLYDSFNQKVKIRDSSKHRIEYIFSLNKEVFNECKNKKPLFILNKYFSQKGDLHCMDKVNTENYINTILYYLFLNNYKVTYGELIGFYYVKPIK